jgi:hypothetical protein
MSKAKTHARRTLGALKQAWEEMDYAQRRLIELNFELSLEASERPPHERSEELESLYRLDANARRN